MRTPQETSAGAPREAANPWGPRLVSLGVLAAGLVVLVGAFEIPEGGGYQAVGPRAFPLIVGTGATLVAAIGVVRAFLGHEAGPREQTHWPTVFLLAGALLAYVLIMSPVGYWQATTVFFTVAARILGSRRWVRDLAVALVLSLVTFYVFDRLFGIGLPPGYLRLAL